MNVFDDINNKLYDGLEKTKKEYNDDKDSRTATNRLAIGIFSIVADLYRGFGITSRKINDLETTMENVVLDMVDDREQLLNRIAALESEVAALKDQTHDSFFIKEGE